MWPLDKSKCWISSLFGKRKKTDGSWGFHDGVDMACSKGTKAYAVDKGAVLESGYARGYGKTIVISHGRKFKTRYAHLDKIFVKVGDYVRRGDIIGHVGDTGCVRKKGKDASHLHFEVSVYGKKVNPFYFLA
jgi:murein DD-endopeptidase MepM/ murein hydrolase activator NlpD